MAIEKQGLGTTPGMFSVGMERTIRTGDYENVRIGFVMSYHRSETDPHDAYLEVRAMLDNWVHELPAGKPAEVSQPKQTPPPPRATVDSLMDAIRPYADRVVVADAGDRLIVRAKSYMKPEEWKELNVLVKGQGGKWLGPWGVGDKKDVHWEVPK